MFVTLEHPFLPPKMISTGFIRGHDPAMRGIELRTEEMQRPFQAAPSGIAR